MGRQEQNRFAAAVSVYHGRGLPVTGTPAGYVCATREMAELRLAQGFRFINYGLDHFVLLDGMRAIRELARQWTEG